jgi:methylmalonyl-CoA/ethylmalonyl-CoA epimerase
LLAHGSVTAMPLPLCATGAIAIPMNPSYHHIDHIALAVSDLEEAVNFFTESLGFELGPRRHTAGDRTGMISAEVRLNNVKFVLCQGTEPGSPISTLVDKHGPTVHHVALSTDDVEATREELLRRGVKFTTNVIRGPGLTQSFTSRDPNTGLMLEFIHRTGEEGFVDQNVTALFEQLERASAY